MWHERSGPAQESSKDSLGGLRKGNGGPGQCSLKSTLYPRMYENILRGPNMLYKENTLIKIKNNF